ncbi:hypothetical protein QBD01_003655 [Ochrobactrum sp. 19YEA23]|uniref:hypothetical protein n=1 Tax=Ochrobactrum sp. 19YEA23 TaxID=3039854 RepID=UPI00247864A1|nr:hypothetical protein [Ochrobactrum sp. 19YEA23]
MRKSDDRQAMPPVKCTEFQRFPCQINANAISAKIDVKTASAKMIQFIMRPPQLNDRNASQSHGSRNVPQVPKKTPL